MLFRSTLTLSLLAAVVVSAQPVDDQNNHDTTNHEFHAEDNAENHDVPFNFTVPQHIFERQLQANPKFDIYMLQMFWWPGHCAASGGSSNIPLCNSANNPPAAWETQLVVHGLWPSYSEEFKTENNLQAAGPDGLKDKCAGAAYVPPADLDPKAGEASSSSAAPAANKAGNAKAKPNPKAAAGNAKGKGKAPAPTTTTSASTYFVDLPAGDKSGTPSKANQVIFPGRGVSNKQPDFYQHEYNKHGKCSGLTQAEYFKQSVALGNQMNAKARALNLKTAKSVTITGLQTALGYEVTFGCVPKKQQLWYVNFCFKHPGDGVVGEAVQCPKETSNACVTKGATNAKTAPISLR